MKQFPYNCSNTVAFKVDLFHNWKNDLKCSANVNWRCSNGVDYRDRIIGRFPRDVIEIRVDGRDEELGHVDLLSYLSPIKLIC